MIPMPVLDRARRGTRANRLAYLTPMAERYPGRRSLDPVDLAALVRWMSVDTSERWLKRLTAAGKPATYCDHYACDFMEQLTGRVVLSSWVWWQDSAIATMRATGQPVPIQIPRTVREHGALSLHDWLPEWGKSFGWRPEKDASGLRQANTLGLIATPKHVAIVLPDACGPLLGVADGPILLTSQAGSRNFRARRINDWYARRTDTGFYSWQGGV